MRKSRSVVLALLAAGLFAAVAGADHHPYKSTVTAKAVIDESDAVVIYSGRVKSPKPACTKGRRIMLSKGEPGDRDYEVLGRTRTNNRGRWTKNATRFAHPRSPTDITAMPKRVDGRVCKKATKQLTTSTEQP